MSSLQVILVDAGTGNLHSVQHALQQLGAGVNLTDDPAVVRRGGRIILPGVGAFGQFMTGLRQRGLDEVLAEAFSAATLCWVFALVCRPSFNPVQRWASTPAWGFWTGASCVLRNEPGLKIPHTGWNQLWPQVQSMLFNELSAGAYADLTTLIIARPPPVKIFWR